MDDADRAADLQQREIDAALTHRKAEPPMRPNGGCHWCYAPVGPRQLFCDSECEQDWSRDQERRKGR
jgi:hypothetical protein